MDKEVAVIRDYDIRDKKLVDATAQTTIESTDAIEMKTTDGNQVFIDKASFIKAVGQAFTASDPKTFTKLLGMNGDGPMGIGASDLASVLGVELESKYIMHPKGVFIEDTTGNLYRRSDWPQSGKTARSIVVIGDVSALKIISTYLGYSNMWDSAGGGDGLTLPALTQQQAIADYNGKTNTDDFMSHSSQLSNKFPTMARALDADIPAAGQLYMIYNNVAEINACCDYLSWTTISGVYVTSSLQKAAPDPAIWIIDFTTGNFSSMNAWGSCKALAVVNYQLQ